MEVLKKIISEAVDQTKIHQITLIGVSVTDHPQFLDLCNYLINQQLEFSIPSVRVETVSAELADLLVKGGMKTIAVAPETGSDTLRTRLNKNVTNQQIIDGAQILIDAGIQNLKLYLMYGLPFEEEEDLQQIIELIRELGKLNTGKDSLRISLNPFIPKAHTPFEKEVQQFLDPNMILLKNKLAFIQNGVKGMRQVKFETLPLEEAYLETILALGNENLNEFLLACYKSGMNLKKWFNLSKRTFSDVIQQYFTQIQENSFGNQPWNFIDEGYSDEFLVREYHLAQNGRLGIHCDPACRACGICSDEMEQSEKKEY